MTNPLELARLRLSGGGKFFWAWQLCGWGVHVYTYACVSFDLESGQAYAGPSTRNRKVQEEGQGCE
jgi:hypothetical protein